MFETKRHAPTHWTHCGRQCHMNDEALAVLHLPQRLELRRHDLLVRDRHREPSQRTREAVQHQPGFPER